MTNSKPCHLLTPATSVSAAIRAAATQHPMDAADITAITCARDVRAIVDALKDRRREAIRQDDRRGGYWWGIASGLGDAIDKLEAWLRLGNGGGGPVESDLADIECTECKMPAHFGRNRKGVCRACVEEAQRDPSADTESPSVRGY